MWRRGEADLVAGQIKAHDTPPGKVAGLSGERDVVFHTVVAHRAHDRDRAQRRSGEPAHHGADHLRHRQPIAQMQSRRPAHLQVVDVLGRRIDG